jgi:retron-type reverse transcriptase
LRRRIADAGVIRLVLAYLTSGTVMNGIVVDRDEGTPQGGPLPPLLANVLLDEVNKKLERRGHCFACYAGYGNAPRRSEESIKAPQFNEESLLILSRIERPVLRFLREPLRLSSDTQSKA